MNTSVTRIASWLIPVAMALALAPAAAMADEPQNKADSTSSKQTEQVQAPTATKAPSETESAQKAGSTEGASKATTPNSTQDTSPSQPVKPAKNGLAMENGHLVNYSDGAEKAISGWQTYKGSWYWFANSSKASESKWIKTGGHQYRLGADGKMLTGTFTVNGALYHATASGAIVTGNKWVKADGKWWFPNKNGSLRTGWVSSGGSWYWLNRDSGAMQTGWIKDDNGKWWFADGSGALASARWVQGTGGSWYRVDGNGAMATGWRQVSGQWYWMDSAQGGKMAANKLVNDNGTYYWCNSSGAMIRNSWCKDDAWHRASGSGAMASGWIKTGGAWYWLDPSDPKHPMLTGLRTINGTEYFFKSSGAMATTCWVKVDSSGNARFASSSGTLGNITRDAKGVLRNNGELCSGWVNLGGGAKAYADPKTHTAKTGWIKSGSTYYYVNPSSGVMATGWQQISNTWYLFNVNGKMLTGWQKISGTWYYMNGSGAMQTGWLKLGDTWYWLDGSGAMATGWRQIGGTWYYFNGSGAWVPDVERSSMTDRIWGNSSGTQWLIAVNRSTHKVGIYKGSARNWSLQRYVDCVTGTPSTPTITGTFRTTGGKRMSLSTDSRARWCTQISGGYFFHTILASNNELGKSLSHGCIRMAYPDAQWIYNNVYAGTTVVIYG